MHYVYVLRSLKQKWIYIGCADDLRARLKQHQAGEVRSTKAHTPFALVYYEAYLSKKDARKREGQLKNNSAQREFLYRMIEDSINMAPSSNG